MSHGHVCLPASVDPVGVMWRQGAESTKEHVTSLLTAAENFSSVHGKCGQHICSFTKF